MHACATDRYRAGKRVRFNKTSWILLTRTYVVEWFWAEFEIRPHGAILAPLFPFASFFPPIVLFLTKRAPFFLPTPACCRWKVRDSFDSRRNGAIMRGALFAVNRKTRILATFRYTVEWNEPHRAAAAVNEVRIIYSYGTLNIGLPFVSLIVNPDYVFVHRKYLKNNHGSNRSYVNFMCIYFSLYLDILQLLRFQFEEEEFIVWKKRHQYISELCSRSNFGILLLREQKSVLRRVDRYIPTQNRVTWKCVKAKRVRPSLLLFVTDYTGLYGTRNSLWILVRPRKSRDALSHSVHCRDFDGEAEERRRERWKRHNKHGATTKSPVFPGAMTFSSMACPWPLSRFTRCASEKRETKLSTDARNLNKLKSFHHAAPGLENTSFSYRSPSAADRKFC